jgi:hypothetical protein
MCLAFAAKGERAMTISLFPEWYEEKIRPLEEEAFRRGLKRWQWGWGAGADLPTTPIGPMCHGCEQWRWHCERPSPPVRDRPRSARGPP